MRKLVLGVVLGFLALLIVPVLVAQLDRREPRRFARVELREADFQEVRFQNTEAGLMLAGMLFVPPGEGPFPAAVVIHGSGSSRRDNGWYLTVAKYLQKSGVAILLPDKRGSEGSEGEWRVASFEELATDAEAAIRYLQQQREVDLSHIGIIGLSQGGHIAPLVAEQAQEDIAFVVNLSGGALPMHEMLVYEETHNLRELGLLPGLSNLLARPAAWSLIGWRQKAFWDAVGNFDPRPYWKRLAVPALVLYGENDTNVPAQRSAEALRSLGNPKITVKIYDGSGHALESPEGEGNSIVRPDALKDIRDFIVQASPIRPHASE